MKPLSRKSWATIIIFGLIGQIAWAIENNEFNLFLFNYIGGTTTDIARMVAWSAGVATITTLVMGTISDRLRHRKLFLCAGYILWGLSVMAFAWISRDNVSKFVSAEKAVSAAALLVIIMDCIMTFFGSTANDASFNSWVTESTDETNRTKVEGVLNAFPLLSMLIVVGASNVIIEQTGWPVYFIAVGILVIMCGIAGLFFVEETETVQAENEPFLRSLAYGFRPSVIRQNPLFYTALAALCLYNTATQIFMPYLFIYLNKTLGFDTMTYSLVMAIIVLTASVFAIVLGGKVDLMGRRKMLYLSTAVYSAGLLLAGIVKSPVLFTIIGSVMMGGFVMISIILMSTIRDHTPLEHVGMFQGIRLLAYVLIPMIIGPYIGDLIIHMSDAGTYINEYGETVSLPVAGVFFAAAAACLLIMIPGSKLFSEDPSANH